MRNLQEDGRTEALKRGTDLKDAGSQRFALHKRRLEGEGGERLVLAVDTGGLGHGARRDHHTDAPVPGVQKVYMKESKLIVIIE